MATLQLPIYVKVAAVKKFFFYCGFVYSSVWILSLICYLLYFIFYSGRIYSKNSK
ncbi:hypothetical protein BDF14DRAFT_1748758 [Spinellus fusiger]|nr:hypothetical protein BDF14DRAFT_1748758 [Spinellus fusiger]